MVCSGSLSQRSLAWHDFDLAFRNFGSNSPELLLPPFVPPQPPSPRRLWAWSGWPEFPPHPPASNAPPQKAPKALGDFLCEILALPSKWFGTPQKSVQRIREQIFTKILAQNLCKHPRKDTMQKKCKIRTKIRAKNPCKKSVQKNPCKKIRAKIRTENPHRNPCKNPCKANLCKWFLIVTLQIEKPIEKPKVL